MDEDDIEALLAGISDHEPSAVKPQAARAGDRDDARSDTSSRAAALESELAALAEDLKRTYAPRAPQLARLDLSPHAFAAVVRVLGNRVPAVAAGERDPLAGEIGSAKALEVRLCVAEDAGASLAEDAWQDVEALVKQIEECSAEHEAVMAAAAAEVPQLAPTLAQMLDARVAARLIAQAGSLRQLAATSPANIVSLRSSPLLRDPLVEPVPDRFKKQALRIVASKAVLAARMDSTGTKTDGAQGKLWRRQIEARINRLLAAPPSLQHRALPKPVDKKAPRRGGKRIRKMKAKNAPSKLAHEQNIVRFGA